MANNISTTQVGNKVVVTQKPNKVIVNQKSNSVVVHGKGSRGESGYNFLSGVGIPSQSLGKNGDTYLDNISGKVYKKISGSWVLESAITTPIDTISFTHEQQSPSAMWVIHHNLGFKPAVSVMDYGQNNVECDIEQTNENQVTLRFIQAGIPVTISGYAFLS
jgi:hypothetical protein